MPKRGSLWWILNKKITSFFSENGNFTKKFLKKREQDKGSIIDPKIFSDRYSEGEKVKKVAAIDAESTILHNRGSYKKQNWNAKI